MLIIVWSLDHNVNPGMFLKSYLLITYFIDKFVLYPSDNIATPIAAALGDLITLYILYSISDVLYRSLGKNKACYHYHLFVSVSRYSSTSQSGAHSPGTLAVTLCLAHSRFESSYENGLS